MIRHIATAPLALFLLATTTGAQENHSADAKPVKADAAKDDVVGQQASRLEAELARYSDTAPEAADAMVRLVDLYHEHARLFGLVRVGQRFIAAHPTDKRHADVMLKLMDGLEATSRNKELTVVCRQFLQRYPQRPECPAVEVRLARTLDQMSDLAAAADAHRSVWRRQPATEPGRLHAIDAIRLYAVVNDKNVFSKAAELADELLDKLPPGEPATQVGWQGVSQWRRGSEWARSNLVAAKMLAKGLPADPKSRRELHRTMAESYANLGQHANAVASLVQARNIEDGQPLHYQQIYQLYAGGAKPNELEPLVNDYIRKYPDRDDRFVAQSYLAHAFLRSGDAARGASLLAALLPHDAVTNSNASAYVQAHATEEAKHAETERVLQDAISKNDGHAHFLRYVLAFQLYRDRMKDEAKTRQVLRELATRSPSDDGHTYSAIEWLLNNAPTDQEFQAEVTRLIAARRQHLHLPSYRGHLATWAERYKSNKDFQTKSGYVVAELKKADVDPIVASVLQMAGPQHAEGEPHRAKLLEPAVFGQLNDELARLVLATQGQHYWHYRGDKRPVAAGVYAQWVKRFPKDFQAAVWYLHTATDYSPPEVQKEAALHLLTLEPNSNHPDVWRRLMIAADNNKDAELVRRALQWIRRSQEKFGKDPTYASYIGDVLAKHALENEAVDYWTTFVSFDRDHTESAECAARLRARMADEKGQPKLDERIAFVLELRQHDTAMDGRYAEWLAGDYLAKKDLDSFEKVLADALKRRAGRPFHGWYFNEYTAQQWIDGYRNSQEATEAEKRRVFAAVRDLDVGRASASAAIALLEITPSESMTPLKRLLAFQAATRMTGDDAHDWDRLMPYVQAALGRDDFPAAAALLTGMLSNVPNVDPGRKKAGREMIAQCYSRMGAVGLTIDETSPVAPLLQAALYLRLGDQRLALEAYTANKALFDQRRDEVPVDLLLFVCENHIAAGGDENHDYAEEVLRGWLIKNSESKTIENEMKARVQLLLARNFFKARRYDIARGEFTTVINRYPDTPQAIEAEFGIGETFMEQKVYDQAEAVFEKLAGSREADVVVRAEFLRGVLTYRRGDHDEAREIFRRVLERVPNVELANQALFSLAEVYGAEQRYIEQLGLLRTVGRLGRHSKRWHAPGTALSIVVQDSDLGISRGHSKIPVRVTTAPGGDEETIYLTSGGAGKGLFRADLETRLGQVVKADGVLQLTGRDTITCDYPDDFKKEFKHVPLSDAEIRIADDAEFKIASSRIVDEKEESFSDRLQREAERERDADLRVSQNRPAGQIKPGNLVYMQVKDADRDLGDEPDSVVVKLTAESGDQVQVTLKETGPHTGVFEGTAPTGELPAGALASDTSIEHSPLMAIDRDPKSHWLSQPDGATPKSLTVDMKDLKLVSRVRVSTPDSSRHAPVRGTLVGSNDGRFWFRIASNPAEPKLEPAVVESGRMARRVYDGNYTGYSQWSQILHLGRNVKPVLEDQADELTWIRPGEGEEAKQPFVVIWHGRLVQERTGAMRIQVNGTTTAVAIDDRLELPVGPGGRHVDIWLEAGTHDLTIFAARGAGDQPVTALRARADNDAAQVTLAPFQSADFDLDQPAAQRSAAADSKEPTVNVADKTWEFQFKPQELRYVRFVIDEYLGEAVAINQIEIGGEEPDQQYIPTEADVLALANNDVLEIAGGDVVTATYGDELTQSELGRSRLLTARLTATYFNAQVTPIAWDVYRNPSGTVSEIRKQLMRIDPGERIVFEIVDYDKDQSAERDTVRFQVFVNDGEPVDFTAAETDQYTGIFTKEIDTSGRDEQGKLRVKPGDRIYCRYIDAQNTFPGHAVPREAVVFVNAPSLAQIRLYETRVVPQPEESDSPPQILYRLPRDDDEVSRVAFEAPLTVEVIDPDQARDSRSTVTVTLATAGGATVEVECVLSSAFTSRPQTDADNWPLREGRFVGQVVLQLGGANSPSLVPLSASMPRNLVGGPRLGDEAKTAFDRSLMTRVLNLTGQDAIHAAYRDALRPAGEATGILAKGRLISNGRLACTDRDYEKEIKQLHVGERLFLMVNDADRDTSDERDSVTVELATERGEKETLRLHETLAHSGVFTGSFPLKPGEQPTPGNLEDDDPAVETYFGDTVRLRYLDEAASTESGTLEVPLDVPVVIGTDGLVAAFSKTFGDERLAVETKFHIAESYFELFKSHKKLGRKEEQKTDLEAGRRVLREVIEDYPDPKYVPRIAYLLGQFAQELAQWGEAIESYEMIVRQYPEHSLAPDAQYKLAQCYEEAGGFDEALEAYVTLAATYPKSPLIASVMIRISDHFYKGQNYEVAAQVGEKFLERFESHQFASRMAFRVGQCYFKNKRYPQAGTAFDLFAKRFPDDPLCSDALFWSGESFRTGGNNREAFIRFNNCRWKFPASDAAKYARGRLALPEMIQQFEAEAQSVDETNN